MVCTISGTTITAGTDTVLSTNTYAGYTISAVLIDTNKVFIAHTYDTNRYLSGMVCTISGTTITAGTDTQLSTSNYTGDSISAVLIDTDKVFIAHSGNGPSNLRLYGAICTISGTTITVGTDTQLSTNSYSGTRISAVLIDTDKVFIAHSYGSSYYLYGMVCTISETTITTGTDTRLSSVTSSGQSRTLIVMLSSDKVFIAYRDGNSFRLYTMVCTISETTITAGTDTVLSTSAYSGQTISAVLIDTNKVFIAHSYGSSYYLYGMVCTISGTTITAGTDTELSSNSYAGQTISAVLIDTNKVFIAHSYDDSNRYLNGMMSNRIKNAFPITQTDQQITGVAKTSGTSGDTVQVYEPDYN